ncbi:DUF3109 family protein [Cyclobacterium marinum]|uniref:DUF3109 family protein n=1 Tax=Cyclobacterium marinum (strain ATCC 25205 / DSM 745 / LMG 13164 / NCIMB 1802) TaxID=880070 RepID=G0IW77_CYCMS|nr:DUF3109 family protein [Cyclobacterium marinum]AEL26297.1 hypothetical protein Cycma_2558 [Cyclobacterium marinum DSM 745]MBI0399639.1 DUF3109 family protein [Cyclobacterium marinum]MBR9774344.1 DUF3109 family protein [Cytophagales bacterium]
MILVENAVISDDIKEQFFVCDLEKCKGACCVEGDAGAPLQDDEIKILEKDYPSIAPFLTDEGRNAIAEKGTWVIDQENEKGTTTIGENGACAFAITDEKGILKCGIEEAYNQGETTFKKPISCHLYPIRITKYDEYEALNYDRWEICDPACSLGSSLGVPLYRFLKGALVRKYGEKWYEALLDEIGVKE